MAGIHVTLPDGKTVDVSSGTRVEELAARAGVKRGIVAAKVNGRLVDLSRAVDQDATLQWVSPESPEGLDTLRHSTAHLMAQAVQNLFPGTQVTIGPTIENGFYYDFKRSEPFSPEELERIEKRMQELVKADLKIVREELPRGEAIDLFRSMGEHYKVEIIEGIPDERVSLYRQGDWLDLCRGPHVPSTAALKAFKLTSVAGAYWRGDSRNEQLQRIYGTAWASRKDLDAYLKRVEEAKQRDHRRLGPALDLFSLHPIAPGSPFFHPKGTIIYNRLIQYIRELYARYGYSEVVTPLIYKTVVHKAPTAVIADPKISDDELLKLIPGPDFPTGGVIQGRNGIIGAYKNGRGAIVVRGVASLEEIRKDRYAIVVTELPFMVNKARWIEATADMVREKKLEGISDIRDESNRTGIRVVFELKKDANDQVVLASLFKFTSLQTSFSVNFLAIVDSRPVLLTLKRALQVFVEHRREVVTRRTLFDLREARARREIVEGLGLAVMNIDRVIEIIRGSKDTDIAKEKLMAEPMGGLSGFLERAGRPQAEVDAAAAKKTINLTARQAQAMQVRHGGETNPGADEAGNSVPPPPRPQARVAPVKRQEPKISRNDLCPCGSGEKFKKCHGAALEDEDGGADDASA